MPGEKPSIIASADALSPQGCGAGTENACFALTLSGGGQMECALMMPDKSLANEAGIRLGWRLNIDPSDDRVWCPKGVLEDSKQPDSAAEEA
jgi:hypothetical protein